jgi:hypothetical protein
MQVKGTFRSDKIGREYYLWVGHKKYIIRCTFKNVENIEFF